jgi:putative transposase
MSFGLVDPNDPLWPEAERRAALLRDLLRQSDWKVTADVANAAYAQLGIPRSTMFRAVARFCRTRRASSLLPLKRGTRAGSSQSDPRIERIIKQQIERFWLKKEKHRFSASWSAFTTFATSRVRGRHIEKQSSAASWA